uniref:Putative salivary secreted protein n=1 Tax=Rhipicephalus microplus TaxID=6941 RepID=A0A6G5A373_RHIMP
MPPEPGTRSARPPCPHRASPLEHLRSVADPDTMIKILILLALLALFAVSYTVAKPQYVLTYGYPYHYGYYGAYYPHYFYGR